MEIIVGKTAGFCYGVKRAVEGAKEKLQEESDICCLGEIVHNKEVIKSLENSGMKFIDKLEEAKGKVIIRAHGVSQEIEKEAKKQNIELIDYTCPNVLKIHKVAEEYARKGFYILLLGSQNHPENIGTISYCGKYYKIIEQVDELEKALKKFAESKKEKLLIIEQTTYSMERFLKIQEKIQKEIPPTTELVIKNTICAATKQRQKETEEIAKKVDAMIIIGGSNSSNTKKLYEIAKQNCNNTFCVETKDQMPSLEEMKEYEVIGIMAGASTPQESIDEIIEIFSIKQEDVLI